MIFFKEAVNHMRTQSFDLHGSCCMCRCPICLHHDGVVNHGCLASKNASKSTTSLLESILCPILWEHSFQSYQCLMGTCNACGLGKIQICPREETEQSKQLSVKFFENIASTKLMWKMKVGRAVWKTLSTRKCCLENFSKCTKTTWRSISFTIL